MKTTDLLTKVQGGIGWITLNRPAVLNALTLNMIRTLTQVLKRWETNSSIQAIIIEGAGEKAFCAGGDIRTVYEAKKEGDLHACDAFFREEYTFNTYIHTYSKPYVSLINGIALGGGLGISVNGAYRLVTERALLAMPETGIGFFPDAGATTFLNKAPGVIGLYLGLTGTRLKAEDALMTGLATHFLPSSFLSAFKEDLQKGKPLEGALAAYCQEPQEKGFLQHHSKIIEGHFNKSSLKEIVESLTKDPSPFAQNTYNILMSKSPTSLAVFFRQLKEGKNLSFLARVEQEFRLSQNFLKGHDFMEGVRAVLIDKDHLPRWKPSKLEDLRDQDIETYFSSLGERELVLEKIP